MAIAKVQFKADASATPEVWMDTTQKTVAAGKLLSGETALKNDGTDVVGSIASKSSSDLTASGATVTAPAGYYAQAASKSVASGTAGTPTAAKGTVSNHTVTVTPSVTNTTGYITGGTKNGTAVTVSASELVGGTKTISSSGETDVTNYASASVAAGSSTTPATSITANPSISVSASGLITATASASKSVTPSVSAGYVSSGTAGTVTVSGSNTQQLSTQAAATITPSTTSQTAVAAGKYTTGAVTVDPIPPQYIVPSGTKEITENGTGIDVSSYAAVDVAVPGQEPTGIKYIYTDIDGEGAWDVGGYKYCSVDYAPLRDNKARIWVKLIDDLSITINISCYQTNGVIAWGDNTTDEWSASAYQKTHTYATGGIYAIEIYPTGGDMYFRLDNLAFSQSSSSHDTKVVGAEMYNAYYKSTGTTFRYCENLKRVTIAEDVYTSISADAFSQCISLETIKIPESATDIGIAICDGCTSLLTAYLPSGITKVPDSGFRNCSSLREVHMASTTPPTMSRTIAQTTNTFYNTPSTMVIYVPYSSDHSVLAAYQSATNWSSFASQMQEEPQ